MAKKKITIHYKKKKIDMIAKDCNVLQKFVGLMFSRRKKSEILLFSFRKKQKIRIHSWCVFYPFVAFWIDDKNRALELKIVKPFRTLISPKKDAYGLIEIPMNHKNKKILKNVIEKQKNISITISNS